MEQKTRFGRQVLARRDANARTRKLLDYGFLSIASCNRRGQSVDALSGHRSAASDALPTLPGALCDF